MFSWCIASLLIATTSSVVLSAPLDVRGVTFLPAIATKLPITQVYPGISTIFYDTAADAEAAPLYVTDIKGSGSNSPATFDFIPTDSGFMAYSQSQGIAYGHLALSSNQNLHLTVDHPGRAIGQTPYLTDVFGVDDSSQLLQFWSFNLDSKQISFIGIANRTIPGYPYDGPYGPAKPSSGSEKAVLANVNSTDGAFFLKE